MHLQPFLRFEVVVTLVALVGPPGSAVVIDPQTWWKFLGQEKGSVIKTWDMLLSSSIRYYYFGSEQKRGFCMYLYLCIIVTMQHSFNQ